MGGSAGLNLMVANTTSSELSSAGEDLPVGEDFSFFVDEGFPVGENCFVSAGEGLAVDGDSFALFDITQLRCRSLL